MPGGAASVTVPSQALCPTDADSASLAASMRTLVQPSTTPSRDHRAMADTLPFDFGPPEAEDDEMEYVKRWFGAVPNLSMLLGHVLRGAIDDVLDTFRTGRFDIVGDDVGKTEKSHVGTRAEIRLISELAVPRGRVLDMDLGHGVEVDVKHTLKSSWMIPREAVGRICLCLRTNDRSGWYSAFIVRADEELLGGRAEGNGDRKRGLTASSRALAPLVPDRSPLPENLLLTMPAHIRSAVLEPRGQERRFIELFSRYPGHVVSRHWILAIGQKDDSPRRVRAVKPRLRELGFEMLCGTWLNQRQTALEAGFVLGDGDWVSVPVC